MGLGKSCQVMEAQVDSDASTFMLKVEEMAALWPEESARAGTTMTCHDHVAPMRWRHLNVFNRECEFECALPRRQLGVPCDAALGGA